MHSNLCFRFYAKLNICMLKYLCFMFNIHCFPNFFKVNFCGYQHFGRLVYRLKLSINEVILPVNKVTSLKSMMK